MTENEFIKIKREEAKKFLPMLKESLEGKDPELIQFIQEVVDNYMMNICKVAKRS